MYSIFLDPIKKKGEYISEPVSQIQKKEARSPGRKLKMSFINMRCERVHFTVLKFKLDRFE